MARIATTPTWRAPDMAESTKSLGMDKTVAIIQSSYIPWKGYFDIISRVDEFIFLDDVQFTKRDWRNRNRIMTAQGPVWLTIPVKTKGRYHQLIEDVEVENFDWAEDHWRTIRHTYRHAPYFEIYADALERLYADMAEERMLSRINKEFISTLGGWLGISTPLSFSRDYKPEGSKTDRLVAICRAASANAYLSGPSARAYIENDKFDEHGIALQYQDYSHYPVYPQRGPAFEHGVSVLDLLFNVGPDARNHLSHRSHRR